MLEKLFSSKTRVEILGRALLNENEPIHAREISRIIGPGYKAVWLELKNLERLGILTSQKVGKTVRYKINPDSRLVPSLKDLFLKNWLSSEILAQTINNIAGIVLAFIYGSFASGKIGPKSDVDIIIIGKPDSELLDSTLSDIEFQVGREINYRLFSAKEWIQAKKSSEPFIVEVLKNAKVFIKGTEDELEKMA